MRRPATRSGVGVQTLDQLQRKHRRLDRNRKGVTVVLAKMQRGQVLHLSFEQGTRRWLLSDGTYVSNELAMIVTADRRVQSVGDALFKNMPGQTWRWSDGD
jgi:hypothetical protein